MEPDQIRKDVPIYMDDLDVVSPDSEMQHRFGPPNGCHYPHGPGPCGQLPGAGAQPI